MMNKPKKYREEFEYSSLYDFIYYDGGPYITSEDLYKKIDQNVVLDLELTKNDLAIYLSIVLNASFKNYFQEISNKAITRICGVSQSNQSRSIQKLENKGYITISHQEGKGNSYKININPKKYLPLKLEQFDGLRTNKHRFIRRLRGLFLSNGNNAIPTYKTAKNKCNGKLIREEYNQIKSIYDQCTFDQHEADVSNYLMLEF